MTNWNTSGLPPSAAQRMQTISSGRSKASMLSVAGAISVQGVGFVPVSEVMGAIVLNITGATFPNCGYYPGAFGMGYSGGGVSWPNQVATNDPSQYNFGPTYLQYGDVLTNGWTTALARMELEAKTIGAHGVIDIRFQQNNLGSGAHEFVAMGTAIRAMESKLQLANPFTTHLNGTDVSKLFHHGYAPVKALIEISIGVRHDDYATLSQASAFASNTEVSGYTELVTSTRANARRRLGDAIRNSGADGAIIDLMQLSIFENEPYENHRDHVAEVKIVGTTLTPFSQNHKKGNPLTILSLK